MTTPMHPRDIVKELEATFFAPKPFAKGTIIKCVKQPRGQRFPVEGELVVVVAQGNRDMFALESDGSPQSAGDMGDLLIARPKVLRMFGENPETFGIWRTHSSFFVEATEAEIDAWTPGTDED